MASRPDNKGFKKKLWNGYEISLGPARNRHDSGSARLFDIAAVGAVRFENDKQGRIVIRQRIPGPAGFTSMAHQPFADKVLRVVRGKLVDVTPELCSQILAPGNEDHDEENAFSHRRG